MDRILLVWHGKWHLQSTASDFALITCPAASSISQGQCNARPCDHNALVIRPKAIHPCAVERRVTKRIARPSDTKKAVSSMQHAQETCTKTTQSMISPFVSLQCKLTHKSRYPPANRRYIPFLV